LQQRRNPFSARFAGEAASKGGRKNDLLLFSAALLGANDAKLFVRENVRLDHVIGEVEDCDVG
jgi:hypothetical protein